MSSEKKDLEYYLGLGWTYLIETEESEDGRYYIIHVNELPGICTDATTIEEGMQDIKEAIEAAIVLYLEQGDPIPEPIDKSQFKGKIHYRTTAERHYEIARAAKLHHQSLSKTLDCLVDVGLRNIRGTDKTPRP